jgi:hypothetical protein
MSLVQALQLRGECNGLWPFDRDIQATMSNTERATRPDRHRLRRISVLVTMSGDSPGLALRRRHVAHRPVWKEGAVSRPG